LGTAKTGRQIPHSSFRKQATPFVPVPPTAARCGKYLSPKALARLLGRVARMRLKVLERQGPDEFVLKLTALAYSRKKTERP
jgi:hypothetical protein